MTPPAGPTKRRTVVACLDCGVHWSPLAEPARCVEGDHRHQHFEVHLHRSVIVLPDGTSVMACSFDPVDPYTRDRAPDYGLYLDPRWQPPWAHDHLRWPDFGVPANTGALTEALGALLERARADEVVEIGCLGGHGRTGTALGMSGDHDRAPGCRGRGMGPLQLLPQRGGECGAGGPHSSDFGLKIRYDTQVARDP